jgi:hypothetical protein
MIPEQKKNPAIAKKPLAHRTEQQSRMQLSIVQASLTLLSLLLRLSFALPQSHLSIVQASSTLLSFFHGFS